MVEVVQNTLAAGELSPHLYGRSDLAKYHAGAMLMRNVVVDYRGGGSSRPGTQYVGLTNSNGPGRVKRFVFSATQTYMLVFTDQVLQFIRNPLTVGHINGSNAGFIESSPGVRYFISTPYIAADLAALKFSQSGDVMTITHPAYAVRKLTRITDTNWTLTTLTIGTSVAPPTSLTATITGLPAGSTDPQNTNYNYVVTAVGQDGQESQPTAPVAITGINIAATQGTVTLHWNGSPNADFYNVYKTVSSSGLAGGAGTNVLVPPGSPFGFIGTAYGVEFSDTNIIADFTQSPPSAHNPFANGRVIGYNITNPGAGYPVVGTTATITDPNGGSALLIPVLSTNVNGATGTITGFVIFYEGAGITNGASIVAAGGGAGFVGTVVTSAATGATPAVSTFFQQRQLFAASNAQPLTLFGSKTAFYNNFDKSNPPLDSDAYEFTLAAQEVNAIRHLVSMPGGLVIFSDGGVVQLTGGGGSTTNPSAVTPSSAVIVPQSYYGASNVPPIVIDKDILYVQTEGSIVRDLTFNLFVNMYSSADLTLLSNHFFAPYSIVDWAYQDVPNKIVWCLRNDGVWLSLTYLKEQDIYGWAAHNTQGVITSIENVREGTEDAIYMIVSRTGNFYVERLCGRYFFDASDAWCLDAALYLPKTFPAATLQPGPGAQTVGSVNIPFSANAPVFAAGDVGKRIKGYGAYGIATITAFNNTQLVTCSIQGAFGLNATQTNPGPLPPNSWTLAALTSIIGGLAHLDGSPVFALVDGTKQGPFIPVAGNIVLTTPGFDVLVGLQYIAQLQQLSPVSAAQGKRGRTVTTTTRVMNTGRGLKIGASFDQLNVFNPGISSTDPTWVTPYQPNGLVTGDLRMNLGSRWETQGGVCVQMEDPLPFTVLAFINEDSV